VEQIAMVVSLIGVVAALLAAVGIVGLVAYSVSQRIKEIAIRRSLGEERVLVLEAVLRRLFRVSNLDPAGYAGAIVVLVGIVALLPARRPLQLNLAKILHYE
jgi:ABC-type antimicrobial peptide transport system permease subunit